MTRPLVPRLPKPWRPRPILPLLTLAVVVLGIATSAGVGLRTSTRFGSVPAAAVSHSVQIAGFAFAPQAITVTAGDSITWTNQDEAPHTVTTSSGPQTISSPSLSKGQSFTFRFTVPGMYSYYCAVHPDMRAQVVVNPAPAVPSTSSPAAKPSSAATHPSTHSAAVPATHSAAPSTRPSEHDAPSSASSMSMPSSASSTAPSSAAAVSSWSSVPALPAPSTSAAIDAAPASAAGAGGQSPLNPTLVLAGLTAGATVFCLLLVASRRPDEGEDGP